MENLSLKMKLIFIGLSNEIQELEIKIFHM